MKIVSEGLFDRLSSQMAMLHRLPTPLIGKLGPLLAASKLLRGDSSSALKATMASHVREGSLAFFDMIGEWIVGARRAPKEGKKVILVPFNFPVELLHAFESAVPLTSEVLTTLGVCALSGQGEKYWDMAMGFGLPDHMCSANTIELGSMLGSDDFRPQAIVSSAPGGCDVNSKIHELVANHFDIPHFFLQKPPDDTGRGREVYGAYMKSLVRKLEDFLGEELSEDKLRGVTEKANRCTELYYELWDLHKAAPCPVPNLFSLFIYGARFSMWGTDPGIRALETLVQVSKERLARKAYPADKELARCLWAYTSYYYDFMGFFNWMEEKGYTHLGDGLDLCFPRITDTENMDSMIDGLAEAAWNMPMTRQVGGESMSLSWANDVIWAAGELAADCVIYCGHHSCKQTWSVVSILRKELEERIGLPLLVLQGDAWIKRMTPISVLQQEIDEFIKNVVTKKSSPRRKLKKKRKKADDAAGDSRP